MTLVTYLAVFLSVLGFRIAMTRVTIPKLLLMIALLLMHIGASVLYCNYTKTHVADSYTYYYDSLDFNSQPWYILGTTFIVHITRLLKTALGASYFDCFMMFQVFGFWGLMILVRMFDEISARINIDTPLISQYLFFLPSVHYWTSGLGKDAIIFFAAALGTWCVLNLSRRLVQFFVALLLMALIRAHVAVIVMASLALASALHRNINAGRRMMLIVPAVFALAALAPILQYTLKVNITDPASMMNFFEDRSTVMLSVQGNTSLNSAGFFVRLLSLLFRPLFFDAPNALGLVASLENVGSILLFLYLATHWRDLAELYRKVFFIRFALIFSVILIILLAILDYNVGLGLRQRTMVLPSLLSIFVAVWAFRQRLKGAGQTLRLNVPPQQQMMTSATAAALDNTARPLRP